MISPDIRIVIESGQMFKEVIQNYINLNENPANSIEATKAFLVISGLAIFKHMTYQKISLKDFYKVNL